MCLELLLLPYSIYIYPLIIKMRQRKLVDFEVHFIWCLRFQFIPYYLKK